ncbi:HC-toxin synthetase [Fulvia fulva]|uniref:HC-toxin synthetase n=1 Tax=Passalora fulva TaxID=5499 RepID=A0A9Q8P5S8_PASFU|nr:HC-toxin synthetase [Fulvia fulva]KAK4632557.1 HC-toxin synthetase [Fulvia fulva]UJO14430.1 HC-toxin synthetase [Fulvia fulva]WPV10775.1 HC-toxin synthetase [Fulvia fulva]
MLAIVKAGAAVLPLAPKDSNSRLQALIEHSECSLIVASPIQATRIKGLDLCKQSAGIQIMQIDADAIADCCRARRMPHSSSYAPIAPTLPSDLAYVLFTSGTSLHSKGMMYTEYTFDNSIQDVFGTLSAGGCIVVPSDAERANNLLEFCEVHHVNALHITPTVLRLHFAQPSTTSIQLKSLVIGGEPVRDHDLDILRQWAALCKDLRAFVAYGSTETCIDCIARQVTSSEALAPVNSIGSPISFLIWQTWLVSPLTQRLAPVGAQAELYVGGPAVARGYLPSNEVSQTGFLGFQDPFYGKSVNVEPKDQQPHIRFPHP